MIPRERALMVIRRRRHHWVPMSERTTLASLRDTLRDVLPLALPVIGSLLKVPEWMQRRLESIAYDEMFRRVVEGHPWNIPDDPKDPDA